jgi:hypothetical protein
MAVGTPGKYSHAWSRSPPVENLHGGIDVDFAVDDIFEQIVITGLDQPVRLFHLIARELLGERGKSIFDFHLFASCDLALIGGKRAHGFALRGKFTVKATVRPER